MKKNDHKSLISLGIILTTLFSLAFIHLEKRRSSYEISKMQKELKELHEKRRFKSLELAKLNRPQYVESIAEKNPLLKKANKNQIIYLVNSQ